MSRFLTPDEFIVRVGEDEVLQIAGTGYSNGSGRVVDEVRLNQALGYADDLINGFVLGRHPWLRGSAPGQIPELLKGLASDIARYRLRDEDNNRSLMAESVRDRYRDALLVLGQIQKGQADLVNEAAALAPDALPARPRADIDRARLGGPASCSDALLSGWLS